MTLSARPRGQFALNLARLWRRTASETGTAQALWEDRERTGKEALMYWTLASVFLVAWGFLMVTAHRMHGYVHALLAVALLLFAAHAIQGRRRRRSLGAH
jgi:hypothetical protein